MNRIYYRLLKLVNPGKRWYSHKPLQKSTQRGHFAEPPEMVASSLHRQRSVKTVNFVLTGHLEFSFSPIASWFLSVAKVFGQNQNCERDPEMH